EENSTSQSEKPPVAVDSTAIVGTSPKVPLELTSIATIDDDMNNQSSTMQIELGAMGDFLVALRSCSQEYLEKHCDPTVTYKDLMISPEKYRGKIVKLTGIIRGLYECSFKKNTSGLTKYWKGIIFEKGSRAKAFISIEKPPDDIKV